jgi:sodium transport system permease protein
MRSAVLIVFVKEFLENLRDRRTVLAALVLGPLFAPLIFGAMLKFMLKQGVQEPDRELAVAMRDSAAAPNLRDFLAARGVKLHEFTGNDAAARAAIRNHSERMILAVPADHGERLARGAPAPVLLFLDASNNNDQRYLSRLRGLLNEYSRGIAGQRLALRGLDPLLLAPVPVQDVDVSTPASRSVLVLGMLGFFLIIAMMSGGLYLAIDTTAGERERGTLEPLLTLPVPRTTLLYGKLLATCSYMLLSLLLTTTTFFVVLGRVGLEDLGMSANLGAATALAVIGVTMPLIPAMAALMTLVAAFTRSVREAQAWLGALQLVPSMPLIFASVANLAPTTVLMAVPSLSQHFLIMRLLRAEALDPLQVLVSAGSSLALGVVLVVITGRIYRREALVG